MSKIELKKTNLSLKSYMYFCLIVFLAFLSTSAWWEAGKSQKNISSKKEEANPKPIQAVETESASGEAKTQKSSAVPTLKTSEDQKKPAPPSKGKKGKKLSSSKTNSRKQEEDVLKIQAELGKVISQTSHLQNHVRDNRIEIQQILERARIHEKILRSIAVPTPVRSVQQISADEILRREKLRLIAEQTQQSQDQLRAIQLAQSSLVQVPRPITSSAKPSKTS